MRKRREFKAGRCYHLVGRIAHRAFFLDDEEKARRGYAFMYWNAADWEVIRECHELLYQFYYINKLRPSEFRLQDPSLRIPVILPPIILTPTK